MTNDSKSCSHCRHFIVHNHQHQSCALTNLPVDFVDTCELFEQPIVVDEQKQQSKSTVKKTISIAFVLYIVFKLIKLSGVLESKPATPMVDMSNIYRNLMVEMENKQWLIGENNKRITRTYFTKDRDFSKFSFEREMKLAYMDVNDSLTLYDTLFVTHELYYGETMQDSAKVKLHTAEGKVINYEHFSLFQKIEKK